MSWIEVLAQDLRHGFPLLGRAPQLNIAIILTLSLGIGVNLAGFPRYLAGPIGAFSVTR